MSGKSSILTFNGGSSGLKLALYGTVKPLKRGLYGTVEHIGLNVTNLTFHDAGGTPQASRKLGAVDHKSAANSLIDRREKQIDFKSVIREGPDFPALKWMKKRNNQAAPIISSKAGRVAVRVIRRTRNL